jgi:Na+/melibiose symporter-like transporter
MTNRPANSFFDGTLLSFLVLYVVFRAFTTLVIMPFAVAAWDPTSIYFLTLLMVTVLTTILAFTRLRGATAVLALVVTAASLCFWWLVICNRGKPIWSDFKWTVVPEVCFGCAALLRWFYGGRLGNQK